MRQAKFTIITLLLVLLSSIALLPAHAATLTVTDCTAQSGNANRLAETITAAASGDTIDFSCGTVTIPFTAQIIIDKDLTINGAGVITFDGGNATRFFTVNAGNSLTVDGITFQNGNGDFGGAIDSAGTLTISNSTFSGNSAQTGGAIANLGTLTISNSTISGNSATNAGGAIVNFSGTLTISNSTFSGNSATVVGGAIVNPAGGTLTISNSTFSGNSATLGGAILSQGTLTVNTSTFSGNSATLAGGAINNNIGGTLTINTSTFTGNSATNGGGIVNFNTATISNSTISGNSSTDGGGAIYNDGTLTISNSTISGNSALTGGAIFSTGTFISQDTHYEGDATNNTCESAAITDNGGNTRVNSAGCPGSAPIVPVVPVVSAPLLPDPTALGCVVTADVDVQDAGDNTYCRILMTNGAVVNYSGAVPAELIGLGVILAVDVYRLEGGATINTFPNYTQICLSGTGRLFYMDSRNAPRVSIELARESIGGATCGWIPAPGTLILTN